MSAPPLPGPAERLGPFELLGLLGEGGTAQVYLARRGGELYALKLPRLEALAPRRRARLEREAELAASFEHPHLVPLLERGEVAGQLYLLYPLVVGQPLDLAWVGRPLSARITQLAQVARALGHAHQRGVVHRDLKPANVLVDEQGKALVTDFGAARLEQVELTRTGEVVGTPRYLAPELLVEGSREATPAADVWSLGLLLYLALGDEHPFAGCSLPEQLERAQAGLEPPMGPPALRELTRASLAWEPGARPRDGDAFAAELERHLVDPSTDAAPAGVAPTEPRAPARDWRAELPRCGPYLARELIGRGGMGRVYRAWDEGLAREVALKLVDIGADPERRTRFLREAEAASRVRHPNLVAIHSAGIQGPRGYLAMELVEGGSLSGQRRPPREAARLVAALARAVGALHAEGLLHRDLKPSNVLMDADGRPRLTDFGVAKVLGQASLTRTGQAVGTPLCMAPEQLRGETSERSDVYGLGLILYALIRGAPPPVTAHSLAQLILSKSRRAPPPTQGADPALDALCQRALAPTPSERFPSAEAFAAALSSLDAPPRRRRRPGLVAGALLSLALIGLAALAPLFAPREPDPARAAVEAALAQRSLIALAQELDRLDRGASPEAPTSGSPALGNPALGSPAPAGEEPGTPASAAEAPRPAAEAPRPASAAESPRPASETPRPASAVESPRPAPETPRQAAAVEAPRQAAAVEAPRSGGPGLLSRYPQAATWAALGRLLAGAPLAGAREALDRAPEGSARDALAASIAALDSDADPRAALRGLKRAQRQVRYDELDDLAALARARLPRSPAGAPSPAADLARLERSRLAPWWRGPGEVALAWRLDRPERACQAWPGAPEDFVAAQVLRGVESSLARDDPAAAAALARRADPRGRPTPLRGLPQARARLIQRLDRELAAALAEPEPRGAERTAAIWREAALIRLRARLGGALRVDPGTWVLRVGSALIHDRAAGLDLQLALLEAQLDDPARLVSLLRLTQGDALANDERLELIEHALARANPDTALALRERRVAFLLRQLRYEEVEQRTARLLPRVVGEPILEPEVRRHRAAALLALGRAREALEVVEPVTSAGHLRAYARLLLGEPLAALDEARRHLRSGRRTSLATTACLTSTLVAWEAYLAAPPRFAEEARAVLELYERIPGRVPVSLAWLACLRWECGARAEAIEALRALGAAGADLPPGLLASLRQERPAAREQLLAWARSMVAIGSEHALPGR